MRPIYYLSLTVFCCFPFLSQAQNCQADFTFGETNLTIDFFDQSTSNAGDPIVAWDWDFGDGGSSNQQNPTHTFPDADDYDVCLTITTQSGCTDQICIEVDICVLQLSVTVGQCDGNDQIPVTLTVNDPFDAARDINISVDGTLLPGSPFEIQDDMPVMVNFTVPGDGLDHTIFVNSIDIGTCTATYILNADDCSSNCFLGSMGVDVVGGQTFQVNVGDDFFSPVNTTITVGDLVNFNWIGSGHSTTSDATAGPDSWNSGVIDGPSFDVSITNPGVHPFYCIPHGGPGGTGMSGVIVANCPPSNSFNLLITFQTTVADPAGYDLLIDGVVQPGSPFSYSGTGSQSLNVTVAGDGQNHVIAIRDVADPSCIVDRNFLSPDCGAAPTCSLSLSALENGACNAADQVPVELTINAINPGSGFTVAVDGNNAGSFSYDPSGVTVVTINVPGDGQSHSISVQDNDDNTCSATTSLTTTNCTIPCSITNLSASTGSSTIHTVEVQDFVFSPVDITITAGDQVQWVWTGQVAHTSTSDATTGPDSWESGLLNNGDTYTSPVLSAGLHPYYCIPHGAPGGVGMAGTITVQADCTNGQVSVALSFQSQGGSFNGYEILVDGNLAGSGTYDASGTTSTSVLVAGDGQSHTIQVRDADDPVCLASTTITTPDCNASSCALTISAQEDGPCDGNDNVSVSLTINDTGGGSGFTVAVDGNNAGSFSYDPSGVTVVTINVPGDGQSHSISVQDNDDNTCSATTSLTTTNCTIPCSITNLSASTGSSTIHTVEVQDFVFSPVDITITAGDQVQWVWTGQVAHTSTSDATTGPDSWESGLLDNGDTYTSPVLSAGLHPYYCIPHGAPGGVGMAGTITVQADCTNGQVNVALNFQSQGGSFNGYEILVDGNLAGSGTYDPSGTTSTSVLIAGDGQSHTIQVRDADDPSCLTATTITTPDCNASSCALTVSAQEDGPCDGNDNVSVSLTINDTGGGSGFTVAVDGNNTGSFTYDPSGTTVISIAVPGDGQSHDVSVQDNDDNTCSATTSLTTTNCTIPCSITNLSASTGSSTIHTVEVQDFVFDPVDITITAGDQVQWVWTGQVAHTSTSDASSGPDSWESGLLDNGDTYTSPVLSAGLHPYYCIPHGAPGGVGMAGTITVQADCTNGQVNVALNFQSQGGSFNGYEILVDGNLAGSGAYDPSGTNSTTVLVTGDGQSHTILVRDADDPSCLTATSITTPDCNASSCALTVSAQEDGPCDGNDNVSVSLTINDTGGGSGFTVAVDGNNAGSFSYDPSGTTVISIAVPGDGQSHSISVQDNDDNTCSATTSLITTNCTIPCSITNLSASTGSSTIHTVEVQDFVFDPVDITITAGDQVQWVWTGQVAHTSTSDASSGPDSWESGLLDNGATYTSPVLSAGLHPYYCIPHGAPGGVGMAGTITVQADCTNGQVSVALSFQSQGGSFNGYEILVDGTLAGSGDYDPSGTTSTTVLVDGDGQSHTILIQDTDDTSCSASTTITTPDCNASSCALTVSAQEEGPCDDNDNVSVSLTINDTGGGSGFTVAVDGNNAGSFIYDPSGVTEVTINVPGDGQSHDISVQDNDDNTCSATTSLITTNCTIPCSITNLSASTGSSTIHTVEVQDFVFDPVDITITAGDQVQWVWTGQVAHTSTSDASSGPDSWESGLLDNGATYTSPVLSAGLHPYYCIPHGAPGGVGMAGTITVQADCTNGQVSVALSFQSQVGSFNGYEILVDGTLAGSGDYDPSGTTSTTVLVDGDGQSHTILIQDADDTSCSASTTITTPDCNASSCALTVSAQEEGPCDDNDNVSVNLTISDTNGGDDCTIFLDGNIVGSYPYDGTGTTNILIDIPGDGQEHLILVQDNQDNTCQDSVSVTSPDCSISCELSDLNVEISGEDSPGFLHIVDVLDFSFEPAQIDIQLGDTVRFDWVGQIPHSATSDVNSGPDSWDSGVIGEGSVYDLVLNSTGEHPYYCIPHGAPGGIGMAGNISVQGNCENGLVQLQVSFSALGQGTQGFDILVDGVLVAGSPFSYQAGGQQSQTISVFGDGANHSITVQDHDFPNCSISTNIDLPDCGDQNLPCELSISDSTISDCDDNGNALLGLVLNHANTTDSFALYINNLPNPFGLFAYDNDGTTEVNLAVSGTGSSLFIEVVDLDSLNCSDQITIQTPDCDVLCSIDSVTVELGNGFHIVSVEDFSFSPAQLDVLVGDTVRFVWNGVIPHSTTSDATTGPNSWNSGVIGEGSIFDVVITEPGLHPYYCIPHGGPGGIGMAGLIEAREACQDSLATINYSFSLQDGGNQGYLVYVDGMLVDGPIAYDDPQGFNQGSIQVLGDGTSKILTIQDALTEFCAYSVNFQTPDCDTLCSITNVQAVTGSDIVHEVLVEDFKFSPKDLTVRVGETIRFVWTGVIPHTATTDATEGPDSWDSGLLGEGAIYEITITEPGSHPYYCIPHGGPGGIGMAGTITALPSCQDSLQQVQLSFTANNGSASGYQVFVDGMLWPESPYNYQDPEGENNLSLSLLGNGETRFITIQDLETDFCAATTSLEVPNCFFDSIACSPNQLSLIYPSNKVHLVEVLDFSFSPKDISINEGDTVRFVWTGEIPHTTTSDATEGESVWESGLLGQGAVYDLVLTEKGLHPYYCIPHGGPGGIGMAGSIQVVEDCDDNWIEATASFQIEDRVGDQYSVRLDNEEISGSPFDYEATTTQSFPLSIPADGAEHDLAIIDMENNSCRLDSTFLAPSCSDACAAFQASFSYEIDSTNWTVQFSDQSQGAISSWLWGFGDGSTSTEASPSHTYQGTGLYQVCLLVQNEEDACNAVYCEEIFVGLVNTTERATPIQDLWVFPNPMDYGKQSWWIEGLSTEDLGKSLRLSLFDTRGAKVWVGNLIGDNPMVVDTERALPRGLYHLLIVGENRSYRARLVIQ